MPKRIEKIILFLGIVFVFFLKARFVFALELHYPTILGQSINDTSSLAQFVCYFFGLGTELAIFIAIIAIAFGGVYYLVSYGRGKFTSEAKDWIKAGVLGLLIVVCASLIAYTINPDLNTCKLAFLPANIFNFSGGSSIPPGAKITTYKEIPIGILTENLLTKTMDCYGFDQNGDPVDGPQIASDGNKKIYGPTYLDHDRADCIAQLTDGAQKKAQLIAALSDEITKLMNQCSCANPDGSSKCDPACGGKCDNPTACPNGTCAGACVGGACQQPAGTNDCCPAGVKDQIEHGPISLAIDLGQGGSSGGTAFDIAESPVGPNGETFCQTEALDYSGLDEFRCQPAPGFKFQQCSGIIAIVEKQIQVNNKTFVVIDQDKWNQLNLLQQLTYFKEKIKEIEQKIQDDEDVLDQARAELASPQCYLATPYIDLLKTYEGTDKTNNVILTEKTFYDPETKTKINASKYCEGFNYNNSSCLKKCDDMCPDTSQEAIDLYKKCNECDPNSSPNALAQCLSKQEKCIEDAYNSRPCTYASADDKNAPKIFKDCISSCQGTCADNCKEKYLPCSDEYNFCQSQCTNNSQCVLDNAGSCLFGSKEFQQCASQTTDQGNTDFCINNAYSCKNGSNEYAGYSDCSVSTIKAVSGCDTYGFSASSFYEHPECQKCQDPYAPLKNGGASCQTLYPETAKCPTSSNCPNCPCDQIDNQSLDFSVPNESIKKTEDTAGNQGDEGYTTQSQTISAYQMIGPQCNNYSYNDDPLTFYCQDGWWNNPNNFWWNDPSRDPLGSAMVCPKEEEVPVGQTVDDAKNWADTLITNTDKINKDTQDILDQMEKIGKAKDTSPIQDYCKCGARLETNAPICETGCQYNQWQIDVPVYDDEGNQIGSEKQWQCNCTFTPCKGSPCQQITDYLSDLWNSYRQLKLDFIDFYTTMLSEPRSDIMKELTYSRQTTNSCSLVNNAYGSEEIMLNCGRVEDELMPPINTGKIAYDHRNISGYCYGKNLGKLFNQSLTDNWFCCQEYRLNPSATIKP